MARRRRAGELFERVGLADRADARPSELSGGEQQRVALCAALVRSPRLILADEPTGELDAATAQGVYTLIRDLAREQGSAALIVSHDIGSAAIADRMIQVRDGRVSAEGPPGEETLVVAPTGWVRLPEDLLERSGIGSRARPSLAGSTISLTSAGAPARVPAEAPLPRNRLPRQPVEPRGRAPARRTPICDRCGGHGAERGPSRRAASPRSRARRGRGRRPSFTCWPVSTSRPRAR